LYIGKEEFNPTEKKVLQRVMHICQPTSELMEEMTQDLNSDFGVKFKRYAMSSNKGLKYLESKVRVERKLNFFDIIKYYDISSDPDNVKNLFFRWILSKSGQYEQSYKQKLQNDPEKFRADFDIKMAHFPEEVKQKLKYVVNKLVGKFREFKRIEQEQIEKNKLPKWRTVADYVKFN
jgi:hypothetical protein